MEKDEVNHKIISKVSSVAWYGGSQKIKEFELQTGQKFGDGINVLLKVTVEYNSVFGLKLVIHDIDPAFTIGKLEQRRQKTLQQLLAECGHIIQKKGDRFITRNNSLKHRAVLQHIAVVTSKVSAGYEDFIHTLQNNDHGYQFKVDKYFTTIQGESNAELICTRIREICSSRINYDAIVIIRGGGTQTDFLIFDDYELCRAVAELHIPVITGIGHLRNESIVDLMAHTPTKTPTKAAEHIIAHNRAFEQAITDFQQNIVINTQQALHKASNHLQMIQGALINMAKDNLYNENKRISSLQGLIGHKAKEIVRKKSMELDYLGGILCGRPSFYIERKGNDLENYSAYLKLFIKKYFQSQEKDLASMDSAFRFMSPVNILKKGFAIVYSGDQIITSGDNVALGSEIKVRMADCEMSATTKEKKQIDGNEFNL